MKHFDRGRKSLFPELFKILDILARIRRIDIIQCDFDLTFWVDCMKLSTQRTHDLDEREKHLPAGKIGFESLRVDFLNLLERQFEKR